MMGGVMRLLDVLLGPPHRQPRERVAHALEVVGTAGTSALFESRVPEPVRLRAEPEHESASFTVWAQSDRWGRPRQRAAMMLEDRARAYLADAESIRTYTGQPTRMAPQGTAKLNAEQRVAIAHELMDIARDVRETL